MDGIAVFGIGSTHFRYTVGTPAGEFLTEIAVEPTRPQILAMQIVQAVQKLQQNTSATIVAVAVSCTGLVDTSNGIIREMDTKYGTEIHDIDLRSVIRSECDLPLFLANDCSASALGEWYFGADDAYDCVAHVTFGTGIGAGVVERGRLLRGESGQAAEVGLFPVAPTSGLSSFGVPGAWEAICSGGGIPHYVAHRLQTDDRETTLRDGPHSEAEHLFEAANDGDTVAKEYLDQIAQYNAAGIGTLCNAYNPGLITIGGGVALNNQQTILDGIRTYLDDYLYVERPDIQITELGDDIGLYGALAHGSPEREVV
ncbi:ROK family protein [Haladaptatus sp. T7]|uniref:ROK family protein n=1 Tax=Haladaptatus sp. T7 TaxID=2029368 RepID=UPI0021A25ADC|nr:ROK family protein [Haladaptatus sp. T7]GKZ14553.1 glucokinase [Haladaptatus sp. T7]